MKRKNALIHYSVILLTFAGVLFVAPPSAHSQNTAPQNMTPQNMGPQDRDQDRDDITRRQLADFDRFLDNHPEVAEQLRKDPSLVNNRQFVEAHSQLQQYLQQHPEIQAEISQNPNGFMHLEDRYDRREDRDRDATRGELANLDRFLDSHPEIAEQLKKDPSLADNKKFLANHPALQQFLADHPGVREQLRENPNAFMHQEDRFDQRVDQDRDANRRQLATMDQFLDRHPEIAEQLRKDPSLVDNRQFMENHPALGQFLADHPELREEFKQHPNAFMRQEDRFDRREDSYMRRDRDVTNGELSSFNAFMEGHSNIAGDLSRDPSLAKNQEYLENHSELKAYLSAHPQVNEELSENPQGFMQSAQQFSTHSSVKVGTEAKPK